MSALATIARYASPVAAAALGSLIIAPLAPGVIRTAWPTIWLIVLLGFERHGTFPGIIGAVVGGLALESVATAPFGAILGPLVILAVAYGAFKKIYFDPTHLARACWSLLAISLFFILRSVWIHIAVGVENIFWPVMPAVIVVNCAGYAACVAAARLINTYGISRIR